MKTLYLHIGTPKTGTSAIQYFCVINRDALENDDLYYPDFGYRFARSNVNRNGAFYIIKIFDEEQKRLHEEEKRIRAEGLEKLKQAFETHDTILLSDEGYWNNTKMQKSKDWAELREFCDKIDVQLKIIVYLRRQDEVIQSFWAQKVKEYQKMSLSEFIASGEYTMFHLDYYSHLQEIASVIGKENIIVKVYEKGQYQGKSGTLISDFFSIFGIDVSEGYIEEQTQVNSSLHGIYLETKRLLNHNQELGQKRSFVIQRLKDLQAEDDNIESLSKMKQFSYEEASEFLKNYEEGNQKVAKEYLNREDGILFYKELDPKDYSHSELNIKDIQTAINICSKIIVAQEKELKEAKAKIKMQEKELRQPRGLKNHLKKYLKKLRIIKAIC